MKEKPHRIQIFRPRYSLLGVDAMKFRNDTVYKISTTIIMAPLSTLGIVRFSSLRDTEIRYACQKICERRRRFTEKENFTILWRYPQISTLGGYNPAP